MATILDTYDGLQGEILGFANPQPLDLASILSGLSQKHKRRPGVPVPSRLVMRALRLLETMNVQFPFRSDSLLGLVEAADFLPGQEPLAERGVEFRGLDTR
jgi:hypothetical protein